MDTWTRLAVEVALKQPVRTRRTNENPNYSFHVQYLGLSILHWWFKKQTNKKKVIISHFNNINDNVEEYPALY